MRIFRTYPEAIDEIKRELKEMGIPVKTLTMQDKDIADKPEFATVEIQNYCYTVTNPMLSDLSPTQPWADAEWNERRAGIEGRSVNPGEAYKLRPEVWDQFITRDGEFDYSYSERFEAANQVQNVIARLKRDPSSRQLYVAMWQANDSFFLGKYRVPCSLGWHFQFRAGALHMMYFMRSCDFHTHFQNDLWMARQLQLYIADQAGVPAGYASQFVASMHVYAKDVSDVF